MDVYRCILSIIGRGDGVRVFWRGAVLNSAQQVVAAYRYDLFGNLLAQRGTFTQPFRFMTKRTDTGAGLVSFGYRFYAPELGRWMTKDPLGETGGLNLYAYVGNNPVNWVDPWGLQVQPYQVGTYDVLTNSSLSYDDLAIHHVVQKHPAAQIISGYDPATGPSIALPTDQHRMIPNLKGSCSLTPRQLLARDIKNLRQFTMTPKSSLKRLIQLNKQMYPRSFMRPIRVIPGIAGVFFSVFDVIDAQKRAKDHGISVWQQMNLDMYEGMGYTILYIDDRS